MIIPVSRSDNLSRRGKAAAITLVIAGLFYLLLALTQVPENETDRSAFREVDLASFLPPPPAVEEEEADDEEEIEEVEEEVETIVDQPLETPASLEQLDLNAFLPEELNVETPVNNVEQQRTTETTSENIGLETNDNALAGLGSLDALDDFGADPGMNSRGRAANQRSTSGDGGLSLSSGSEGSTGGQLTENLGGSGAITGESSGRADVAAEADMDVQRFSLDDFGDNYDNLEVQELITWMRQNPGEMPIGVRQLVRHEPSFLTSATTFLLDGKVYELFLMCKESLSEVHIVLVDVDDATYLVDRSFQKMSTLFREGNVQRSLSEEIVAVNSRRNAASDARSREFYGLFLSWWEQAKKEVQ